MAFDTLVILGTKISRGNAFQFMKTPVKVGDVIEPNLKANVSNLLIGFSEQVTGATNAHAVYKLGKSVARGFFKEA